jgi:hypothetical protein
MVYKSILEELTYWLDAGYTLINFTLDSQIALLCSTIVISFLIRM